MDWKVVGLLLIVLGLAVMKGLVWLEGASILVLILWFIAESTERPKAPSGGGKKEEILTPVIVTDVGEPPLLYPKNFKMKVYTKGVGEGSWFDAVQGAAALVNLGYGLLTGKRAPGYRYDERFVEKKKEEDKKDKGDKK